MYSNLFYSSLLILICAPLSTSFYLSINLDSCSGNEYSSFALHNASIDCDGGCSWGSTALISGLFEIKYDDFNPYANVTATAWAKTAFDGTINLCGEYGTTSIDGTGAECPEVGLYEFSDYATLPQPRTWMFRSSIYLTATTIITFDDEVIVCSFSVVSSSSLSNTNKARDDKDNDYEYYNFSAGIIVAGVLIHGFRRHRRIAAQDDDNATEEKVVSNFDLMGNSKTP